ncbi:serine/threonine protein kinase IRE [Trifolium medium]|uniref:Serine/threonine protein kinase IRE n=1 Tax=Trifolium medium TaxID=97028 RepID=A0A392MN15_9FABA|nr:serine/threonine protein kinase IRE [Trifolium medium]
MFIPSAAESQDTSYFMSRYIWNPEDEHCAGASDFDDITETYSSGSGSGDSLDEDGDVCGSLRGFNNNGPPQNLEVQYSFSNFSFKNLSQLVSINYDMMLKNSKDSPNDSNPSVPP